MARTIEKVNSEIEKLKKEKNKIRQKTREHERKARTNRICKRGGYLESVLPDIVQFTDEQFEEFIRRTTANRFGNEILQEMMQKYGYESVETSSAADIADNGVTE